MKDLLLQIDETWNMITSHINEKNFIISNNNEFITAWHEYYAELSSIEDANLVGQLMTTAQHNDEI